MIQMNNFGGTKKKNKIANYLIILSTIFIIIGLGGITHNYYKENFTNDSNNKELLVKGNKFSLKDITFNTNDNTKQLKVSYNGKNHDIKIKMVNKNNNDIYSIEFQIYIDNDLIHTISGGTTYNDGNILINGFDGYIYIIDSKYLAIILPENSLVTTPAYKLTFYNQKTKVGDDILVKSPGKTLCADKQCNKIINNIENIEFDGKTIKYWWQECLLESNIKYEVKFDGETVTKDQIEKANNMYDTGVVGC